VTRNVIARLATPQTAVILGGVAAVSLLSEIPLSLPIHQFWSGLGQIPLMLPFMLVGVIVARAQPVNPIGWILIMLPLIYMVSADAGMYAVLAYRFGHPGLPLARLAVFLTQGWTALLILLPIPILLFPDAQLSRRWRRTFTVYLAIGATFLTGETARDWAAFTQQPIKVDSSGELAIFTQSAKGFWAFVGQGLLAAYAVLGVSFIIHQVVAYRGSTGARREQLKWLMSGGAVGILGFTFLFILSTSSSTILQWASRVAFFGVVAVPVSIGVGILRYRLYEIDRIVSRTLSYAALTGLLVVVYVGIVAITTRLIPTSSVGVAAATLVAVALFNPLRRRIQRIVDRRFNRVRYNAGATVAAFTATVRSGTDIDRLQGELIEAVRRSVQPSQISVWIAATPHAVLPDR
jgi:hypothetical protein